MKRIKLNVGRLIVAVSTALAVCVALSVATYAYWSEKKEAEKVTQLDIGPYNPSEKYIIFKGIDDAFRFTPLVPAAEPFDPNAHYFRRTGHSRVAPPPAPEIPDGFPDGYYVRDGTDADASYRPVAEGESFAVGTDYFRADYECVKKSQSRPDGFPDGYFVDESPGITAYAATGYVGSVAELMIPDAHLGKPVRTVRPYPPVEKAGMSFAGNPIITEILIPANVERIGVRAFAGIERLRQVKFSSRVSVGILPAGSFPTGYFVREGEGAEPSQRGYVAATGAAPDGATEYFIENHVFLGPLESAPDGFPTDFSCQRDDGSHLPLEGNVFIDEQGTPAQNYAGFPDGFYVRLSGDATPTAYAPARELNYFKTDGFVSVGALPATPFPEGYYLFGYKRFETVSSDPPADFPDGYYVLNDETGAYDPASGAYDPAETYYTVNYVEAPDGASPDGKTVYHIVRQKHLDVGKYAFAGCGRGNPVKIINERDAYSEDSAAFVNTTKR